MTTHDHDAHDGAPAQDEDCAQVLSRVHAFLDHELDAASCDEVRAHLEACEPCMDNFDAEQGVKQLVNRCCRGDAAPQGLRSSIMMRLTTLRREG